MADTISFSDFQKLDIRVGTVIEATVPEWSHWVMRLTVDLGPDIGKRTVFAGIMKFYQPEELIGKQFAFVVNLPPKKIGPKEADGTQGYSEAMLLAAVVDDSHKPRTMLPSSRGLHPRVGRAQLRGSGVPSDPPAGGSGSVRKNEEEKPIPLIPSAPVGNGTSIR